MTIPKPLHCPKCGNSKLWRDGFRYYDGFSIQKYMCANHSCQCRFTPKHNNYKISQPSSKRHVRVIQKEKTKNMASETENTTVPRETQPIPLDVKGRLVAYSFYMKKQNYAPQTIRTNAGSLRALLKRGANLLDSESVKEVLATACVLNEDGTNGRPWSANRKRNVINAYSLFLKINGLSWEPPKCVVTRKIPFIPTEMEIDLLIAGMPT